MDLDFDDAPAFDDSYADDVCDCGECGRCIDAAVYAVDSDDACVARDAADEAPAPVALPAVARALRVAHVATLDRAMGADDARWDALRSRKHQASLTRGRFDVSLYAAGGAVSSARNAFGSAVAFITECCS